MIEDIVPVVGSTVTRVDFNKNKTMAKLSFSDNKSIIIRIDSFIDNSSQPSSSGVSAPPRTESLSRVPVSRKQPTTVSQSSRTPSTMAEFQQLMESSKKTINSETISNLKDHSEDRSERLAKELMAKTGGNAENVLAGLNKQ